MICWETVGFQKYLIVYQFIFSFRNIRVVERIVVGVDDALTQGLGDNRLGFEHIPAEQPGYLVLKRESDLGSTLINFYGGDNRVYNQSFFKQFPKDTQRGYATEITIPVSDIDSEYEKVKTVIPNAVVRELKELTDVDIQWKDFRIIDPFGYYIRITELIAWGQ